MSGSVWAITAKPIHEPGKQFPEPNFIISVAQLGHAMLFETEIAPGIISAMLTLTPIFGSTVERNNTTAAMTNTKRRIFSKAILAN